jgi:hypothetical protein
VVNNLRNCTPAPFAPENDWPDKVTRYDSLLEACEAGVAAEIDNGEMYKRLIAATQRPDILTVFRNLMEASQERHPLAFQRCAGGKHRIKQDCEGL